MVVLKELILDNFTFGGHGVLNGLILDNFHFERVWWSLKNWWNVVSLKCNNVWICYSGCYSIFMYTMDTLRAWPSLAVTIDIIDQSIIVHVQHIHHIFYQTIMFILSLHSSSFNVNPPCFLLVVTGIVKMPNFCMPEEYFHIQLHFDCIYCGPDHEWW